MIGDGKIVQAAEKLTTRPGELARMLDFLIRSSKEEGGLVIDCFERVLKGISTKVLLQVSGHFKTRTSANVDRVVFPKGSIQKAILVAGNEPIATEYIKRIDTIIAAELIERFSKLDPLGKCYIDPNLVKAPLPSQMRSANESMDIVARGTRYPIGYKNTIRLFIHWIGQDIDLSATFHDEAFKMVDQVSYTNRRGDGYNVHHSGDITRAPGPVGASEFIDIDIASVKAYKKTIRYVAMNVYVYSGPLFANHELVYAGWMMRDKPNSNEIFDPKTVVNKFDLTTPSKISIPVVFDLFTGEIIYTDLAMSPSGHFGGNNTHSNRAGVEQVLNAVVNINKTTLWDLFRLHVEARGELVSTLEEAETVFDLEGYGITPRDINVINSEFIA